MRDYVRPLMNVGVSLCMPISFLSADEAITHTRLTAVAGAVAAAAVVAAGSPIRKTTLVFLLWCGGTQTASHHLDKGSILQMVVDSLQECILNYAPQVDPPRVDSI